jgi:hypothetical protein
VPGEQHYYDYCEAYGPSGTLALYTERDLKKKQMCASHGIDLVAIPFWYVKGEEREKRRRRDREAREKGGRREGEGREKRGRREKRE